jgi:hypothetical protein
MMNLTLEQALKILNRNRHRDSGGWHVVPGLRKPQVRRDASASSASWLTEFEAVALAEQYLRAEQIGDDTDDSIKELYIFLCRGGGVELLGVRPEHGDRGAMMPMIAGDEQRLAELREIARAQIDYGFTFRLCRFVNVETLEVLK